MKKICISFVILMSVGTWSGVAMAKILWSCNAMTAQPAGIPIIRNKHVSSHGSVRFRAGRTGTVSLVCPVTSWSGPGYIRSLILTYRDGDGRQGPSRVVASLRRVRLSDGHIETLRNGTTDSNQSNAINSGPRGWASHQSARAGNVIGHVPDFNRYYYYVQITMTRRDAAVPIGAMGVSLMN